MPARTSSSPVLWLVFIAVSVAWGSSYFFIKVGLESGLQPLTLIAWRLAIGIIGLAVLVALTRSRVPRDLSVLGRLAVMGVFYVAVPFTLITWAEQSIDSAMATILQALTPLFALVFAGLVLQDEPITVNKLAGLVLGFGGAAVIVGRHLAPQIGAGPTGELTGELAIVLSCVSYAGASVFLRRTVGTRPLVDDPATGPRALRPLEIALPQNAVAFAIIAPLALVFDPGSGIPIPTSADAWLSVIWLGLIGSAIAYLLYFRLLNAWGAYRASLITYAMPVVGIVLGVLVLGEVIDLQTLVGMGMVIGGIALANAPIGRRQLYARAASPAPQQPVEAVGGRSVPVE
jgi:drug/metabolite transporter (DMT)-like permease